MDISVVIPCFNKEPYLAETLESVMAQTQRPAEIIVIDDGSTDGSAAVATRFGPAVTLLSQDNAGESVARNRGIQEARSEWVALLDADDVWESSKLERQAAFMAESSENPVCVYTDIYQIRNGIRHETQPRPEHHRSSTFAVDMLVDWTVNPSTAVVLREAALASPFPEEYRDSEDVIFFTRLREHGPFLYVPEALVGYRRISGQQTSDARHMYRSVLARYQWFTSQADEMSPSDEQRLRRGLASQLVETHDRARWTSRDIGLVRDCRELFEEILPGHDERPATFGTVLFPTWTYRVRDAFERVLGRQT